MAKITDIILTGYDKWKSLENIYDGQLVIKIKDKNKARYFVSEQNGFYEVKTDLDLKELNDSFEQGKSMKLFDSGDSKDLILDCEFDRFPVYASGRDEMFLKMNSQKLFLKVAGPKTDRYVTGAFCSIDLEDDFLAFEGRTMSILDKETLVKAIADDFSNEFPELKIKFGSKKQNTNE